MKLSKGQLYNYLKVAAFALLLLFIKLQYSEDKRPQTYAGGQKKSVGQYKQGKPEGVWTWWFENGQKMMEGTFVNGKRSGIWSTWYHNGQIKSQGIYNDDLLNGSFISWFGNGSLKRSGNYINDKLHGLQQLYNQQGVLVKENLFSYGQEIEHFNPKVR